MFNLLIYYSKLRFLTNFFLPKKLNSWFQTKSIVWKLDRLGRNLQHLVNRIQPLSEHQIGYRTRCEVIFAALAAFEHELIRERTLVGLTSASARGRKGSRKFQLTAGQVSLSQVPMKHRDTNARELCKELKISRQAFYR